MTINAYRRSAVAQRGSRADRPLELLLLRIMTWFYCHRSPAVASVKDADDFITSAI